MKAQIHPYLLARLIAVQEAFSQPGFRPALAGMQSVAAPKRGNNWQEVVKETDVDEGEGGGRGSARGLRGKNAEHAKAAMRKLTRSR